MKKLPALILLFMSLFSTVIHAEEIPMPEKGIGRIAWVIKCCGSAPKPMYAAFALLAVLIIISVIYYRKASGGEK